MANPLVTSTKEVMIKVYILRLRVEPIRVGKEQRKKYKGKANFWKEITAPHFDGLLKRPGLEHTLQQV